MPSQHQEASACRVGEALNTQLRKRGPNGKILADLRVHRLLV